MKAVLEHNTIWFLRSLLVLVCFFFFQNSIVTVSANTVDSGFDPHNPIYETYTYDKIESFDWVESGHSSMVNWGISKNELGSDREDLLSIERSVARSSNVALRSLTKSNFRTNLGRLTGKVPANSQAHHVFPQKFGTQFSKQGINIHDPKFGTWWETSSHLKNARGYNAAWESFLKTNPNQSQILNYGRQLMGQYGIPVGF